MCGTKKGGALGKVKPPQWHVYSPLKIVGVKKEKKRGARGTPQRRKIEEEFGVQKLSKKLQDSHTQALKSGLGEKEVVREEGGRGDR